VEKEDIWLKSVGQRIRRMNNQLQRAKLVQWQWTKRSLVLMNNYSVQLKVRLIILILIADTGATVHMTPYKDKLINVKTQSTSNVIIMGNGSQELVLVSGEVTGLVKVKYEYVSS
jgi:hypothetical protein